MGEALGGVGGEAVDEGVGVGEGGGDGVGEAVGADGELGTSRTRAPSNSLARAVSHGPARALAGSGTGREWGGQVYERRG